MKLGILLALGIAPDGILPIILLMLGAFPKPDCAIDGILPNPDGIFIFVDINDDCAPVPIDFDLPSIPKSFCSPDALFSGVIYSAGKFLKGLTIVHVNPRLYFFLSLWSAHVGNRVPNGKPTPHLKGSVGEGDTYDGLAE